MSSSPLRIRPAARAVVLAPPADVLLVRFEFPTGTRWALPGGGIDAGETPLEALRRELDEEVGLTGVEIGPHIWTREHRVVFLDGLWDGQHEQIHLVRVPERFDPRPRLDWETLRREFLHEIKWWNIDDIARSSDVTFAPSTLHRHLTSLIVDGLPSQPLLVEV
jgi:8-oxo-dGTP diphosphatase